MKYEEVVKQRDKEFIASGAIPVYLRDLADDKQGIGFLGELPNNPNNNDIIVGYYLSKPNVDN